MLSEGPTWLPHGFSKGWSANAATIGHAVVKNINLQVITIRKRIGDIRRSKRTAAFGFCTADSVHAATAR